MANEKQETINSLWIKYKNNLEMLDGALDKINDLENTISELKTEVDNLQGIVEQKPKEVEVIKEVEVPKEIETLRKEMVYVPLPTDDEELLKKGPFKAPDYDKDKKKK